MKKVLLFLAIAALALVAYGDGGGRKFTTTLTGATELPGPGDPDGSGTAVVRLNPGQEEVCFDILVSNITLPATGAHIHVGDVTTFGGVVVGLAAPDSSGASRGCVSADRELLLTIIQNPENYYVNVHSTEFPAGAIRGQLSK